MTQSTTARQLRSRVGLSTLLLLSIANVSSLVQAQELTPDEAQAIAREAYIYGYPIVDNYKAMYAAAIDTDGEKYQAPFNVLKHREQVVTLPDASIVTPNVDTPYSFIWMELRSEPLVLGVPDIGDERYYSIELIDLYNYTFNYIGSRATGNKAGQYLIAGPNWKGDVPAGISKVIRCETEFAQAIYRTQLRGPDDVENVKNIQSHYTVKTLSEFLSQPKPNPAAAVDFPAPESGAEPVPAFFSTLNFTLQFCPTPSSEEEIAKRFAQIGVKPSAEFDAGSFSPEIQNALQKGIKEGEEAVAAAVKTLKAAEVVGTREYLSDDYLKRAVAAKLGRFAQAKEESLYSLYLTDSAGKPLDASQLSYTIKLGAGELPPVNAFWSITMYDGKSQSLVANPIDRFQITSDMLPKLSKDDEGNVTVHIQHEAPGEEQTANWLPAPKGPFYLVMRLYWPKPAALDGTWVPPLVWAAEAASASPVPKPAGAESAEEVKSAVVDNEPKPELERPTVWGEPTEVQIEIYVIDVDEVNSADQSFAASVYFQAQWKSPSLRHPGPGPRHRGLSDVWNPRLTIVGQQMQWKSYPESVEIEPDGTVIYRQKLWGRFSQPLELQDFPFDRQELSVHIAAAGLREDAVKVVPLLSESTQEEASNIANKFSLPDFDVVSWQAQPQPYYPAERQVGVAGYEMRIKISRQPTYYILKVIIPLCLIVIMSWLPRWIDPEQTGTNIGISTSAFLTLVAYLFAITVLLPRVSYVTRMDRFILLSTLTVFAGLLQTVFNTVLLRHERQKLTERIDRWSRIVYPILLAQVIFVSFII